MSSELRKRVLTAIVGVSVLLCLLIFGGVYGAFLIAAVIACGMVSEFVEITFSLPDRLIKKKLLLLITVFTSILYALFPHQALALMIISFLGLFCFYLFTASRYQGAAFLTHCQELMYSVFGLVYLCFLPLFLPVIRNEQFGLEWLVLFLGIVWAGDTGAYFVGRKWGKRKLYEAISPKKTVEGALGGLASGLAVALILQMTALSHIGLIQAVIVSLVVGVASQVGDLCESLLKRAFDIKDSGSILPGHGGFLDRFDSIVFSLPIMYACTRYF